MILRSIGIPAVPWGRFDGGFETLVAATAPIFWTFFLLTGISIFLFRIREPDADRPFRVPVYPFVPGLFLLMSGWMLYRSLIYAQTVVLLAVVPLACGVPLYFLSRRLERQL